MCGVILAITKIDFCFEEGKLGILLTLSVLTLASYNIWVLTFTLIFFVFIVWNSNYFGYIQIYFNLSQSRCSLARAQSFSWPRAGTSPPKH